MICLYKEILLKLGQHIQGCIYMENCIKRDKIQGCNQYNRIYVQLIYFSFYRVYNIMQHVNGLIGAYHRVDNMSKHQVCKEGSSIIMQNQKNRKTYHMRDFLYYKINFNSFKSSCSFTVSGIRMNKLKQSQKLYLSTVTLQPADRPSIYYIALN